MKISYSAVWNDTVRMLRANASLFIAVAGVFLFLPAVISGYFAPTPTGAQGSGAVTAYYREYWEILLVVAIIGFIGNLALLILALDEGRPTVGSAIRSAFPLLPAYFVAAILSFFLVGLGFIALILPGLYLMGRLACVGPVIVAESGRGPFEALKRSFAVTKGNGWAIAGLVLIITVTYLVLNLAATAVFGSIFLLLDRAAGAGGLGALLVIILQSLIGAAFNVTLIVLLASLYRRLTAAPSTSGT